MTFSVANCAASETTQAPPISQASTQTPLLIQGSTPPTLLSQSTSDAPAAASASPASASPASVSAPAAASVSATPAGTAAPATQAPPLAPSIPTTLENDAAQQVNANESDATAKAEIAALERRFFGVSFPQDSETKRLDRIDRMVYGKRRSGTDSQRLSRLMIDVPVLVDKTPIASTGTRSSTNSGTSAGNGQSNTSAEQTPDVSAENVFDDNYPTITALEQQILGKTYVGLPVEQRLAQLEKSAFGKASDSDDLASRVDRLKQYVANDKHLDENYLQGESPSIGTNYQAGSIEQDVCAMEKEVFGKIYNKDTLESRLNRLDNSVFAGQPSQKFTPIPARVNKLMSVLQPQIRAQQLTYSPNSYVQTIQDKKKKGHPFWHSLGKIVEGVGTVAGEAVGAAAVGTAMGAAYGGYGYGYPGYYGGWGGGWGGYPYYGGGWGYRPGFFMGI